MVAQAELAAPVNASTKAETLSCLKIVRLFIGTIFLIRLFGWREGGAETAGDDAHPIPRNVDFHIKVMFVSLQALLVGRTAEHPE